jgi:hypothetical protein
MPPSIRIVTLDKHGNPAVIEHVETLTLPSDVIIMNPGVPAINTPAFDEYLRAFYTRPTIVSLNKPDAAHKPVIFWRPNCQ